MIEFLLTYSLLIALIAVVYSVLCTEPGEIFSGLYKWFEKKLMARTQYLQRHPCDDPEKKVIIEKALFYYKCSYYFPYKKTLHDYEWLFKPIIGCERCVSGQMALWFYLFISFFDGSYYFFEHIALICLTIYFSVIFKTIYIWQKTYQEKH